MADTPSSRSATVPSLPKSFPPGGLTLATLAFPSREAAAAAADSVAAAHGYPQAFDGLEPPASVYDSAPGLSPELGGPADGPPINPATASPATKVALGLSSGEGTRLASVFAAEAAHVRSRSRAWRMLRTVSAPAKMDLIDDSFLATLKTRRRWISQASA